MQHVVALAEENAAQQLVHKVLARALGPVSGGYGPWRAR